MSGNVLIKGLLPEHEKRAMQTLRSFFIDYGALVNFSTRQWRNVVIILIDKSSVNVIKPDGESEGSRKDYTGMSSGKRKALDNTGFRCVKEGNSYLLEIPHTFKIPALLEFVRVNLPMTSLLAAHTS